MQSMPSSSSQAPQDHTPHSVQSGASSVAKANLKAAPRRLSKVQKERQQAEGLVRVVNNRKSRLKRFQ